MTGQGCAGALLLATGSMIVLGACGSGPTPQEPTLVGLVSTVSADRFCISRPAA